MRHFLLIPIALLGLVYAQSGGDCAVTTQYLPDPPYDNYFYSDCHVDAQVVITSPLPDSNLSIIGPRVIVAWPAGNSGIAAFFQPRDGPNGTLSIGLVNSTVGQPLSVYLGDGSLNDFPYVGVQGVLAFNSSATLTVPILGSVRTIRDFTEGPSLLRPVIQNAVNITQYNDTGASISRLWLDDETVSYFNMVPFEDDNGSISLNAANRTISFDAGCYQFEAYFNYPQLQQLTPEEVLNDNSSNLIEQQPSQTTSLSFLSYSEKLLAGAWRFLTYFGRDSMISALLLEPVLSTGNASAMEAVIGAVLERINRTDGSVCHEETLGDYATYLNLQNNITGPDATAAIFVYPMIDTDFYLPILMDIYFSTYPDRIEPLLSRAAGSIDIANENLTYADLALRNAQKIVNITAPFVGNQTVHNLIHLKAGKVVGQWRDSTYGLGNGRIPFDVNCALAPAALRAISRLSALGGVYPNTTSATAVLTNYSEWSTLAQENAVVWEENTLKFFEINITESDASDRLNDFVEAATFYDGPSNNDSLLTYADEPNDTITFYAIALNGSTSVAHDLEAYAAPIPILHTDTGFHLFLLNLSADSSPEYAQAYTRFLNSTAQSILRDFPAGLLIPSGLVVANPALSGSDTLIANFTNSAYHGTVIWSWQLALMAEGLHRQLAFCNATLNYQPPYCTDEPVYSTVRQAYNVLWDNIEQNEAQLQSEVWSWVFDGDASNNGTSRDGFTTVPLGSLPPPPGVSGGTESNVRQLWSLTFLAVTRDENFA
ncbi:putative Glycogen debranching enzyme [Seiridium cardinale]